MPCALVLWPLEPPGTECVNYLKGASAWKMRTREKAFSCLGAQKIYQTKMKNSAQEIIKDRKRLISSLE